METSSKKDLDNEINEQPAGVAGAAGLPIKLSKFTKLEFSPRNVSGVLTLVRCAAILEAAEEGASGAKGWKKGAHS